ncbi:hypothetical protein NFI96_006674 [Prochilodus magdalenae]|nr:hypothetical protein NFI96_006674 [Prochilodus magdalenae]
MNESDLLCKLGEVSANSSGCLNRTLSSSYMDVASFMHIFPTVYGVLCSVGVLANSLVIYAVATCKKKMVSDIYVLNLAVADLLFLLVMPFNIHQLVRDRQWVFGNFMCKAVVVVDVSNQFTTVGIVTVLCIDSQTITDVGLQIVIVFDMYRKQQHRVREVLTEYMFCV